MRLSRHLYRTFDAVLLPALKLSTKDHIVLRTIQDGVDSPGAIASRLNIPPASISRVLERLRVKELITREIDQMDQRRIVLSITPAGDQAVKEVQALAAATLKETYSHVPATAIRSVIVELSKLEEVMAKGE